MVPQIWVHPVFDLPDQEYSTIFQMKYRLPNFTCQDFQRPSQEAGISPLATRQGTQLPAKISTTQLSARISQPLSPRDYKKNFAKYQGNYKNVELGFTPNFYSRKICNSVIVTIENQRINHNKISIKIAVIYLFIFCLLLSRNPFQIIYQFKCKGI